MTELTDFLTALGWCLFGIAAVITAVTALRLVSRVDRVLTLAEQRAVERLEYGLRRITGKS